MKVLGLILEINPFHKGHQYFINEAIKKCNPDITVAITSTSFTMRGDVSLISKFDKTKILLDNIYVIPLPHKTSSHYHYKLLKQLSHQN